LAGEDLYFDVKVVGKREATADEALTGQVGGNACDCGEGCGCH
jgi:FKBP-type peptidyl-prolyl cis-trans isomerase SlyD